ncbi:hypothetical protein [Pedosphaera parvula]|nr:hypothetical protein [Pedosphaera parvula]
MKTFLAKFKISTALDAGKPIPDHIPETKANDVRQFAKNASALDRALKQSVPQPETSPSLHNSIMQAVRQAERPQANFSFNVLRWLPATSLAALLLLIVWWTLQSPRSTANPELNSQALAMAADALEMGNQISTMPSVAMNPVSDELDRLNQDLTRTADFLLASIP